ncbi:hypothetical protein QEN19_001143 [Hanseniaspora menglaensis]
MDSEKSEIDTQIVKNQSVLDRVRQPLDSFLGHFPLVVHQKNENSEKEHILSLPEKPNSTYYETLSQKFVKIFPLSSLDNNSKPDAQILFLTDLKFVNSIQGYIPATPEDSYALNKFLKKNNLENPTKMLSEVKNIEESTKCCIVLLSNDTIQLPLVIDKNGDPILEEITENEPNDFKTLIILLYLGTILSIEDVEVRTEYLHNINEAYFISNDVFEFLSENKWHAFYKFLQLNHKNPFLSISLKSWDALNWVFRKGTQLKKEIQLINANLYRRKILIEKDSELSSIIFGDLHLQAVIECVENDPLLKETAERLNLEF